MRLKIWHLMLLGPLVAIMCRWPGTIPRVVALLVGLMIAEVTIERSRFSPWGKILTSCAFMMLFGMLVMRLWLTQVVPHFSRVSPPPGMTTTAGPTPGPSQNLPALPVGGEAVQVIVEDFSERSRKVE